MHHFGNYFILRLTKAFLELSLSSHNFKITAHLFGLSTRGFVTKSYRKAHVVKGVVKNVDRLYWKIN